MARNPYFITGTGGYWSKTYSDKAPLNALIEGSSGFWYDPEGTLETHPGTLPVDPFLVGDVAFPFGDGFGVIGLGINNSHGNATKYVGNAVIFTTDNDINIFDPALSQSTISLPFEGLSKFVPYIAPYKSDNLYRTPVPLGVLEQVLPPVLTESANPGQLNGLYAIKLGYVRTFTGGESLSSPASNSVQVTDKKMLITFPEPTNPVYVDDSTMPWDTNDVWFVYATPKNFGNTTVFFKLIEVPERRLSSESYTGGWTSTPSGGDTEIFLTTEVLTSLFGVSELTNFIVGKTVVTDALETGAILSVTSTSSFIMAGTLATTTGTSLTIQGTVPAFPTTERVLELDWSDNDLDTVIPPILNFPPNTTAKFVMPLADVVCLVGTDGGNGVAPSVQNFPESYPPTYRQMLPETPMGVSFKPEDAYGYILCRQSTFELRYTGATDGAPVSLRKISTKGTVSQKSFVVVDGNIFSFTPDKNIVMIGAGGATNLEFSNPVRELIKTWTPEKVVASYDERHNAIVFFHDRQWISYHFDFGIWAPPTEFGDFAVRILPNPNIPLHPVTTAISHRGIVHIFTGEGRTISSLGTTTTNEFETGVFGSFGINDLNRGIVLTLPSGTTFVAKIVGFTNLITFSGVILESNLPAEFQSQVNVSATVIIRDASAYALDRLEDGTQANNEINARAAYQWNYLDNELLGKTIRMAQVVMSNPPVPEPPLNPTPVALLFGADGAIGGTKFTGAVLYNCTFEPLEMVSNPVDINSGVGRLIRTQVSVGRGQRARLHGVKLVYTTTKIPGNF